MTIARPDRRLGRRDRDDHQRDDRRRGPGGRDERAERDDREVHGVEHQLDRHEHRIALRRARKPNVPIANSSAGERRGSASSDWCEAAEAVEHQSVPSPSSRLARNTPPMTAASSSTLTDLERQHELAEQRLGERRRVASGPSPRRSGHAVAATAISEDDAEHDGRDAPAGRPACGRPGGRAGLRLGEHDREQDRGR